jgi:nifR3 family TIM-barrel protein
MNIWQNLKEKSKDRPFTVLAPMEDVTDTVFRQIVVEAGAPDLFFTEFLNTSGFRSKARLIVGRRLEFTKQEKPLIAQIWGLVPDDFAFATREIVEKGFDGVDINMGCPAKKVVKRGACSGLIKNPPLAAEIIAAVKENAGDLPVSVKTRMGFGEIVTEEWTQFLLEQDIAALTMHGRLASEMSLKSANWDEIKKAVDVRNSMGVDTVMIGNGDVKTLVEGKLLADQSGVDGIMIGRGIFENPWVFNSEIDISKKTIIDRLELFENHIKLYLETRGDGKGFISLKKFVKTYVREIEGSADLRMKLFLSKSGEELLELVQDALKGFRK